MKLYYFAHPYSCKDKNGNYVIAGEEANFRLCNYRASRLLLAGYNVYSPISHTHSIHLACPEFLTRHEHGMWYQLDMALIEKTDFDGIILAPGWADSTGCCMERNWFVEHGKHVLDYETIIGDQSCNG